MLRKIWKKTKSTISSKQGRNLNSSNQSHLEEIKISPDIDWNLKCIDQILGSSEDIITRPFDLGGGGQRAAIVYIDGLGDDYYIADIIMGMLMDTGPKLPKGHQNTMDYVARRLLPAGEIKAVFSMGKVFKGVLSGTTALLLDGFASALIIGTPPKAIGRRVEQPESENVVRGPRESFTENLKTNMLLIRRILKNPYLRIKTHNIGVYTGTKVLVVYIEGLADKNLVGEVNRRIKSIDIDGVLESGYIEQLIEDAPNSIFPTVGNTERPDRAAAGLLEGKVAIITDGSPVVLVAPWLFWNILQTPEDYYSRPYTTSILRMIRLGAVLITMFLPAAYVALVSYQPEMLPTVLAITIAASREGIPFPTLVEILLMGLVFESLREAGVRLPRAVGQAVSIVGALVIGDIAVSAGFFSAPGVVITALAGISSFAVPALIDAYIPIRLTTVVLSGFLGFYGLGLFMFVLLVHLCSLRSLGVPYLTPVSPMELSAWKDVFIRAPLWMMDRRPPGLSKGNKRRMARDMKPGPPPPGGGEKD